MYAKKGRTTETFYSYKCGKRSSPKEIKEWQDKKMRTLPAYEQLESKCNLDRQTQGEIKCDT